MQRSSVRHPWSADPAEALVVHVGRAAEGDVGGRVDPVRMFQDTVGSETRSAAGAWTTEPGSGWSVADLEALARSGVPVLTESDPDLGPAPGVDGEDGWLESLECPQLGPVSWLEALAPGGRLLTELESLPADVIGEDYDAVEVVGLWHALEAYCAGRKRLAAAALARRDALAGGLAGLDGLGVTPGQVNIAGDELAVRLGVSRRAANRLISSGRAMTGIGIPTGEALLAGRLDAGKADAILDAVSDLSADAGLAVQERVLDKAALLGPARLRRELAIACAAVEIDEFEDRCAQAALGRRVDRPRVLPHGMASLYAVLPAAEATTLYRALDAAARSSKATGDSRTMDQLRADALAAMGIAATNSGWIGPETTGVGARKERRAGPSGEPGGRAIAPIRVGVIGGVSARIQVTVPFTTLMDADTGAAGQPPPGAGGPSVHPPPEEQRVSARGRPPDTDGGRCQRPAGPPDQDDAGRQHRSRPPDQDDATTSPRESEESSLPDGLTVAMLDGYGPIPGSVARALAAGGPWARLVIDPIDRTVLEASRETCRPPASMARLVRATQPHCACPSCGVASDGCDLNHRIPWPVGPTEVANLDPLCRRDHLLITHAGWSYEQEAGRTGTPTRTWTTGTGHSYTQAVDGTLTLAPRPRARADEPPSPRRRPGPDDAPPF